MALKFGSSVILETRPLVFSKENSRIKSKSSGFQQRHVPLHNPFSAAGNEALFKLAKLNKVDGEEDHDGEPTGEVMKFMYLNLKSSCLSSILTSWMYPPRYISTMVKLMVRTRILVWMSILS